MICPDILTRKHLRYRHALTNNAEPAMDDGPLPARPARPAVPKIVTPLFIETTSVMGHAYEMQLFRKDHSILGSVRVGYPGSPSAWECRARVKGGI